MAILYEILQNMTLEQNYCNPNNPLILVQMVSSEVTASSHCFQVSGFVQRANNTTNPTPSLVHSDRLSSLFTTLMSSEYK